MVILYTLEIICNIIVIPNNKPRFQKPVIIKLRPQEVYQRENSRRCDDQRSDNLIFFPYFETGLTRRCTR